MKIHDNIRLLRKQKEMTLEQLAKIVGTSKQTIARYENGEISNIPYDKIVSISNALKVSPAILMGWNDIEWNPNSQEINITDQLNKDELIEIIGNDKVLYDKVLSYARFIAEQENL